MKKFIIYTDGGARGNPGPAAFGVVICNEREQIIREYSEYLGENLTNNEAEYLAIIFALKKFKALFGKKLTETAEVEIRADSELVINQLNGKYRIEDPRIQKLFMEIWNLKFDFKSLKFKHIPREKNKEADRLVNDTLNRQNQNQRLF